MPPKAPAPKAVAKSNTRASMAVPDAGGGDAEDLGDDCFDGMPTIIRVKPDDQMMLTPEELEKDVPGRTLYPRNPRAPQNTTEYDLKTQAFTRNEMIEQSVIHFRMDGQILLRDSPEAETQTELDAKNTPIEEGGAGDDDGFDPPDNEDDAPVKNPMRNQFYFSERASQSKNPVLRDLSKSTSPPPTTGFTGTFTQWELYDRIMQDAEDCKAEEKADKNKSKAAYDDEADSKKKKNDADPTYSENMKLSIKLMERIVNQNAESVVYADFKYWEDPSDEYRDGEGILMPLWRFSCEKAKRKQVTAIKWNPRYSDLCAVGFGSYDFMKQGTGVICCYSLKNTRFPEYVWNTDAGVCSLDWHPANPAVIAVGLYDGTVMVFDVRVRTRKPIYQSTVRTNKHTDPVWEVRWNNADTSGTLNFFSISSDGRVSNWFLMKNKLESEEVMELKLVSVAGGGGGEDEEASLAGLAGGLCFDFNAHTPHFLVGTEEGRIHKCSKAFNGQYLETYEGHTMAVYTVRWNPFHPKIFISASADWTVKLWDHTNRTPVQSFDLVQAIGDVAWAPYSSTTFAAITADGVVHIYDLSVNRNDRLCYQKVVKKAKLTHVAFNNSEPIIIVGDDRGGVNTLKLSPNLRIGVVRDESTDPELTDNDLQLKKMEDFLEMVTETPET